MKRQLTIFDIQAQETPGPGILVAGETISSGKSVRGRFEKLSASGEWLVRDAEGKLRMLNRTTCSILEGQDGTEI